MTTSQAAQSQRNEIILDMCGEHDSATIANTIYRSLGLYLTPNAVNCVIDRAKRASDPRALARKSRRGRRSLSPWNLHRKAGKRRKASTGAPAGKDSVVLADLHPADAPLPDTALLFINTVKENCKFPLRGSGLSLIVCGARVAEKSSYCPACRERTILRDEGGRTPAIAEHLPDAEQLRSDASAAHPRAAPRVDEPVQPSPAIGIDGVDLALQEPKPIKIYVRNRMLVPRPAQRTFFDRGQLDLFRTGECSGYADGRFSDYRGRAWLIASACRPGTSSPA